MSNAKKWTEREDAFLRAAAELNIATSVIADILGRTADSVRNRRTKMQLPAPVGSSRRHTENSTGERWSADEDKILADHPDTPAEAMKELLPGRSVNAITHRRRLHPAKDPVESGIVIARNAENPAQTIIGIDPDKINTSRIVEGFGDAADPVRAEQDRRTPKHIPPRPEPARTTRRGFFKRLFLGE